jgi:predicted Holliday junction resolvase-like endonuclease
MGFSLEQWIFMAVSALIVFAFGWTMGRLLRSRELAGARRDAVKRSESVIRGQVYEKILPYLPEFPYDPSDMIFVGHGVDYVVFDGLSAGDMRSVVFLEVKSGQSRLSAREKSIARAVEARRVEYREYRLPS